MASNGIRRKVDDLGRVVIPAGIRRTLGMREGDTVEVTVEGERVVIARPSDACIFCGHEGEDLRAFRGRQVCPDCIRSLPDDDQRPVPARTAPSSTADASPADAPEPWPSGPIDGDELAKQGRAREEPDHTGRRPYPPASSTAW